MRQRPCMFPTILSMLFSFFGLKSISFGHQHCMSARDYCIGPTVAQNTAETAPRGGIELVSGMLCMETDMVSCMFQGDHGESVSSHVELPLRNFWGQGESIQRGSSCSAF